ncbi:PTS system N,N'-diacetylchitobiose-specific transporter subunit IIA [Salmonella enterica subsp. diarizonae]|nr:PTS system N,N'-diacetylchitobiose-specific transporter subunit IIA [Salmonella enterica subsp. diarizonae]
MFADEETVMELLIHAGQARSDAMEAIKYARLKDWDSVTRLMKSSGRSMSECSQNSDLL